MVLDLTTHTYSVFQGILFTFRDFVELGKQYRFRSAQSAVAHLDNLAVVVDGPAGSVRACPSESPANGVAYSREGTFHVLPLAGDEALISDATTTRRLDPGGRELAMFSTGGALAVCLLGLRSTYVRPFVPTGPAWFARLAQPGENVPYGVAIAFGALMAFPASPLAAHLGPEPLAPE